MKKILSLLFVFFIFSCEVIFEDNISDKEISVITPFNEANLNNNLVTFSWNDNIEGVDYYRVKVVTPNFDSATTILLDTTINVSLFEKELPLGEYEWSVVGFNSEYQTLEAKNSFTIN